MLVRLRKVVFSGSVATLFGRIGFLDDDGEFCSPNAEAVALTRVIPVESANSVIAGYIDQQNRGFPPILEIGGEQFAIDLTQIEVQFA